jgi:PAS domain S-box-containing protein/putative nucleotidyltransferase with HDIG domain
MVNGRTKPVVDNNGFCGSSDQPVEQQLREQVHFLQTLIDAIPAPIFYKDRQAKYAGCNTAFEAYLGLSRDAIIGKSVYDLAPKELADVYHKADEDLFASHSVQVYESEVLFADGIRHNVIFNKATYYDTQENLKGMVGIILDITERKKAELELEKTTAKLEVLTKQIVQAMSSIAEARDPYTAGHQRGVSELAVAIAREMGFGEDVQEYIRVAGLLHDIGKIVIPGEILTKPGQLSKPEFEIIKGHVQAGYEILHKVDFPGNVAEIVCQHHERLDGSGYPRGLKAGEILIEAQILAVADVVEAMSSHRPYRPSRGLAKAIAEITENQGRLYNPDVVRACVAGCQERKEQ